MGGHGKNGSGLLVHETLKSSLSSEWIYEFVNVDGDAIVFG